MQHDRAADGLLRAAVRRACQLKLRRDAADTARQVCHRRRERRPQPQLSGYRYAGRYHNSRGSASLVRAVAPFRDDIDHPALRGMRIAE